MTTESGELLTIPEAARLLKVSTVTLGRWLRDGRLPAYRVGPRALRIRRADVDALLTPVNPKNGVADRDASRATTGLSRQEGPVSMTLEQVKQYLAVPPSAEELARRQAVFARILDHRKGFNIAPLTTADLIHAVREEEYESYGQPR